MTDLGAIRRKIDLVLRHHGIADELMVDDLMQIYTQVVIAAAVKNAEPVYRTKAGTVLTEETIQALADEAERGYDVSHLARAAVLADHGLDDQVGTFEVDTAPPDDPHRTCRRCGDPPTKGSWTCRRHEGDTSTLPDATMTRDSFMRWKGYWQPPIPPPTSEPVLTRNAVRCDQCREVIESLHRHDFKWCSCKSVAVDGGLDYRKRSTKDGASFTEMSEWT